jgi:hypothetical protein
MVRSDGDLCWCERLGRKEAVNVVDAAAQDELEIDVRRAGEGV